MSDRVQDAYDGKLGEEFQAETVRRLDWMCAQLRGESVLDIGCSQGTAAIIAAGAGFTVTGIDVDAEALAAARAKAATLPEPTAQRLKFAQASAVDHIGRYDSILLGEVLEHLHCPDRLLRRCAGLLAPDGILVATVPLGVSPHPDHKRSYYPAGLYAELSRHFDVVELAYMGHWIGARCQAKGSAPTAAALDLTAAEAAQAAQEALLHDQIRRVRDQLAAANEKYRAVTAQAAIHRTRLDELTTALADEQQALATSQSENQARAAALATAEERLEEQIQARAALANERSKLTATLAAERTEQSAARTALETELAANSSRLAEQDRELATLSAERSALGAALAACEARLADQAGTCTRQAAALEQAQQARAELGAELAGRAAQVEELQAALATREKEHLLQRRLTDTLQQKLVAGQAALAAAAANEVRLAAAVAAGQQELAATHERLAESLATATASQSAAGELATELAATRAELLRARIQLNRLQELKAAAASHQEEQYLALRAQLTRAAAAQAELEQRADRLGAEAEALSARLIQATAAADRDLARLTQQLATAQAEKTDLIQAGQSAAAQAAADLAAQTARANAASRELASELERERAARIAQGHARERAALELAEARRANEALLQQQAQATATLAEARQQALKLRATISYQLGAALLDAKRLSGLYRLPGRLAELAREARRRRTAPKTTLRAPVAPLVPTPPPVLSAASAAGLKVAAILDEFSATSFGQECALLQLSPTHWRQELEQFAPDLLLVESAWRGKDDQWGAKVGHAARELRDIVAWCRDHQVPTAFWNKEDPVHHATFLTTAQLFDHVFTTDIDCIGSYKARLGHDRVHLLPFACQPATQNPLADKIARQPGISFAGAWYARYPDRNRDLEEILAAVAGAEIDIYDRNHGSADPGQQFPAALQPLIRGKLPFARIDEAYKGRRFAINMNSVKQSQSMCARRVFELLACGTPVLSNYARAVALLFGDLVAPSDAGASHRERYRRLASDEQAYRKLAVCGIRKVLSEHTYGHRLRQIAAALGCSSEVAAKPLAMVGYARNQAELDRLVASWQRQHQPSELLVVTTGAGLAAPAGCRLLGGAMLDEPAGLLLGAYRAVAPLESADYYGPDYLGDLDRAFLYFPGNGVGKKSHYHQGQTLRLLDDGHQYRPTASLPWRAGLFRPAVVGTLSWRALASSICTGTASGELLAVDEFGYARLGGEAVPGVDAWLANSGIGYTELQAAARGQGPGLLREQVTERFPAAVLAKACKPWGGVEFSLTGEELAIQSALADGAHRYFYLPEPLPVARAMAAGGQVHLDAGPGLGLHLAATYLAADGSRLGNVNFAAGVTGTLQPPADCARIQLGLRVHSSGACGVRALVIGSLESPPAAVVPVQRTLLVTNNYPTRSELYKNGFVHSRVVRYRASGRPVDVFRLDKRARGLAFHEFEGVEVASGPLAALQQLVATGHYARILVHFLDRDTWEAVRTAAAKAVIWVHGFEVQPWHRRPWQYPDRASQERGQAETDQKLKLWREVVSGPTPPTLVFVSRYLAEQVAGDLELPLNALRHRVVPNPIDCDRFPYREKPAAARLRILSLRPYASATYANDLTVASILLLKDRPWFNQLQFRLVGDGPLFATTVAPVRGLANVLVEQRFLTQPEIAALHADYGVFLCPTRMDTHGVSRDEAMSSGLVPITTRTAAVPEFTADDCALLVEPEDPAGLAAAIERLFHDPDLYCRLSAAAAARVRSQAGSPTTLAAELELLTEPADSQGPAA